MHELMQEEVKALAKRSQKETLETEMRTPTTKCLQCGVDFYCPPVQKRRGGGKFCSRKCYGISRSTAPKKMSEVECRLCGHKFMAYDCHIAAGRGIFCSVECRKKSKHHPRLVSYEKRPTYNKTTYRNICQVCGAEVLGSESRKFCDYCRKARRSGQQAWNWKPERNVSKCMACGKEYEVPRGSKGLVCSGKCWGAVKTKVVKGARTKRSYGGKRPDLGNVYFRSRWEANYARYLNWLISVGQIHSWKFEPDTFEFPVKRGNRFYTPDFKIENNDGTTEYHEIKGWMDKDSATKLKRMKIHHPTIKVVVIDKPQYKALSKQASSFIPGWETSPKHGF